MQPRLVSRWSCRWAGGVLGAAALIIVSDAGLGPARAQGIFGWDWSWESNNVSAELGASVAHGDVNGDGFTDVVVGAPDYVVNVSMGLGAVFIFHGGPSGPSNSPGRTLLGPSPWCRFGESIAVVDVDGDGYDDVFVGAPLFGSDANQAEEGRVALYRGSTSGLGSSAVWTSEGGTAGNRYGTSLAAGDFDGDGYGDIAVGAPRATLDHTYEGRVVLFDGGPSGLSVWPTWVQLGRQAWAGYGTAVANVGDVDANGIDDLAVGAPDYDFSASHPNDGAAWVYLCSSSGPATTPIWFGHGETTDAGFGRALAAAGDVNGDGYGDLVVGAPDHSNGQTFEGKAYVYLGRSGGVMPGTAFAREGGEAGAHFGASVACAGDLNADGRADILIGASHFDGGVSNQGRLEAFFGTSAGVAATADVVLDGVLSGSLLGSAVSSGGDLDGDGFSDLLLGAPGTTAGQSGEGRVYARFGRALLPAQSPNVVYIDPVDVIGSSTGLGEQADHGDFDGDGYSDLVVVARSAFLPGQPIGGVRVYEGGPNGLAANWSWRQGDDTMEFGSPWARFGRQAVNAGDVNGDGFEDLLTRSTQENNIHILHLFAGGSDGLSAEPVWADTLSYVESVGSAGDVNGDGFADIVVGSIGASGVPGDPLWYGQARVYYGKASGLATDPDAVLLFRDAMFPTSGHGDSWGRVVGNAGDLDRDGYSDFFVTHPNQGTAQIGRVFIVQGSPFGADTSAVWTLDGPTNGVWFGNAAAGAGDVNGDGYGDFLAAGTAAAELFLGGPDGPGDNPVWTKSLPAATFRDVGAAGDVDGDGYGDILLGAPIEDHPDGWDEAGRAYLFRGGPSGPGPNADWSLFGLSGVNRQYFGTEVLSIGDVNGDGWGDIAIGAPGQVESVPDQWWYEGAIDVFYGNARTGATVAARTRQPGGGAMPPKLARSTSESEIGFAAVLRSPVGRAEVGLEVEVKPVGDAWGTGLVYRVPPEDTGAPAAGSGCRRIVDEILGGLAANSPYEMRYRTVTDARVAPTTPWRTLATNPCRELVFRTDGDVPADVLEGTGPVGEASLSLNGPNPFRSGATLRYTLPADGPVRLSVFDVNGRLVKSLVDGWQSAGDGSVRWDGTAEHGRSAGSGVFFARLEAGGVSESIRLVRVH